MHKKQLLVLLISFLIPAIGLAFEPELVIAPDELELTVGDSTQLTVTYIDSGGTEIDTVASWTVEPNSLATVSDSGLFIAVNPGECLVTATLDTLEAQITAIIDPVDDDTCQYGHLEVFPGDTLLALGDTLSYQAFYVHSQDSLTKATATWSMEGMPVGTLTAEGFFTATGQGFALIQATVDSLTATAFLVVVDSAADTSGINEITITRTSPSPQGYNVMRTLNEGELWKISGLPYPMNILNGGAVFFPPGSITENIRIHMELPGFAHPDSNAVKIGNQRVVGGVEFQVMVDDTVVEPYNFGTPLIAALVYKRGLIDNLGIDPQDLGLYFAMELGDSIVFDTTGIGYTTVDLCMNRISQRLPTFPPWLLQRRKWLLLRISR